MPGMASFLRIADQQQQTKEARWGLGGSMQAETLLQSRLVKVWSYLHFDTITAHSDFASPPSRPPHCGWSGYTCSLHGDMAC